VAIIKVEMARTMIMMKFVNLNVLKEWKLNYDRYSPRRDQSFLGWDDLMRAI
jgi:hypothetical protein